VADQPNHGRDIESDILRALRGVYGRTSANLRYRLVRQHQSDESPSEPELDRTLEQLRQRGLVQVRGRARLWLLTADGLRAADRSRRVAEARGLVRRAEG